MTLIHSAANIRKKITLNMFDALSYVILTHCHILDYFESFSMLLL